jgi:hypothetical protein
MMGVLSVYATSLSYVNFIIVLYCYMFRSYDHLQSGNMNLDNNNLPSSIVLYFFKTRRFGHWILFPSSDGTNEGTSTRTECSR